MRLEPFDAVAPAEHQWIVDATLSYFNIWSGSWHVKTIHRELQREHQPLLTSELTLLETRGPADHIYFLDVEGTRGDLAVAHQLGRVTLGIHVPWIRIGTPQWDVVGERAHDLAHAGVVRNIFLRGQTLVYLRTPSNRVELREELEGTYLGNVSLSIGVPLPPVAGFQQRVVFSGQARTAQGSTLEATGGWDSGVRWFASGRCRGECMFAAGFTRVDPHVSFYGFQRANLWHVLGAWKAPITTNLAFTALTRFDTSVIAHEMDDRPGRPDLNIFLGLTRSLGSATSVSLSLGENAPSTGLGADWSLHLQVVRKW